MSPMIKLNTILRNNNKKEVEYKVENINHILNMTQYTLFKLQTVN